MQLNEKKKTETAKLEDYGYWNERKFNQMITDLR